MITKLLEENVGKKLKDNDAGDDSLDKTAKLQTRKAKPDKWDCIKHRSFTPTQHLTIRIF